MTTSPFEPTVSARRVGSTSAMRNGETPWFCYIVRCSDDSLYVGIATDIEKRVKRHNWGVGPAFTAKRRPVVLVWSERCGTSEFARRREKEIKGWTREKKFQLVAKTASEIR